MKSYLLPLAAVAGTMITLGLTAITLAGPAEGAEPPATAQVRQMEQRNRLREWSQGLGVDLSGGNMIAQATAERSTSTVPVPTSRTTGPDKFAKDHGAHRDHDKRDHSRNSEHEDDATGESRS